MKTYHWLAALCLMVSLPAYASPAFKAVEIRDQDLAELRGRYVMPGRIISFGIVMSSTWKNASGDVIGAQTQLQIDKSTLTPQFYVTTLGTDPNGAPPATSNPGNNGTGTVTGGAGLGSGQGVTQSVRAAGDGNGAYNNVAINVSEGGLSASNAQQAGVLLAGGATLTGTSGAGQVSVSTKGGGINMSILASNNQGNAVQNIGQGGVLQGTVLTGNNNLVNNMTQLNVVMGGLGNAALNCSLDSLKGLRSLGY